MTWEDEAAPGPSRRDSRSCPCRTDWLQWQLPCHRATLCALSWRSTPDDGAAVVPCAPRDAPPSACLLARPWGYRARLRQRGSAPPRLPRLLPARAPSCWHAAAISAASLRPRRTPPPPGRGVTVLLPAPYRRVPGLDAVWHRPCKDSSHQQGIQSRVAGRHWPDSTQTP